MNRKDVLLIRSKVEEETSALDQAGHNEYARDDRPFINFETRAEQLGITRLQAWGSMALKHFDGICAYIRGHTSQREDVRGRINDFINYLILLRAMADEDDGRYVQPTAVVLEEGKRAYCNAYLVLPGEQQFFCGLKPGHDSYDDRHKEIKTGITWTVGRK